MALSVHVPQEPELAPRPVRLDPKRTALIIVDCQNDFCDPRGALFVPSAPATLPRLAALLERARAAGARVIFTQDWHQERDPEFSIWGEHAKAGTWGAEIVEQLKPRPGEDVIRKLRYDAFYGTSLDHLLRLYGIESVVVGGTVANICVLHTAGSAALRWYRVVVPVDAISALNDFDYYAALRQIAFLYRGTLTEVDKISFERA
jgi:nicotinamidase-related amidase